MVMKSKVRKAVRLAPVLASLSALAMVAACARTNGKTPISPERREKGAIVTSASLFKDYDQNAEANLKFAEHFAGASIVVHGRDAEKVQATIKLMFDNHDPVIVRGLIPFGKENHAVDVPNADQNAKTDITVQAGCGGSDCQIVSAQITLKQEVDEATAQELSGVKGQAAVATESKAIAAVVTATSTSTSTSTSTETAAAGADATSDATSEVKKVTIIQRNVIAFTIESAGSKEETLVQKTARLSKMSLILSGRTATGLGSLKSYEEAYRSITGQDAPDDEQVEVLTAPVAKTEDAATDDVPAQPAPPESREGQVDDDAAVAPAAKPTDAKPAEAKPAEAAKATPAKATTDTAKPAAAKTVAAAPKATK